MALCRANQGAAAFEIVEPLFERRRLLPSDRADLRHRLPPVGDGHGPAVAHLADDLGKPRFRFVDRVGERHNPIFTGQTGNRNCGDSMHAGAVPGDARPVRRGGGTRAVRRAA